MSIETIHWHTLHPRFLNELSRVLDLGANMGRFSRAIVERFGCSTCAVEASEGVLALLPADGRIQKMHAAVAPFDGNLAFHLSECAANSSYLRKDASHHTTVTVPAMRLDSIVGELGWECVDLVKCDIEGAEIEVIDSLSDSFLSRIGQLSIEFHDFNGITPSGEVKRVLRRLQGLGFWAIRMSRVGHQDTLLINRRRCSISLLELLWIRFVLRNWFGLRRVARRFVAGSL